MFSLGKRLVMTSDQLGGKTSPPAPVTQIFCLNHQTGPAANLLCIVGRRVAKVINGHRGQGLWGVVEAWSSVGSVFEFMCVYVCIYVRMCASAYASCVQHITVICRVGQNRISMYTDV